MFVLFFRFGTSILAGSLTLAIMTLPVIISTSEEALRAVPQEFRTVSASLGGTRWQGTRTIVLPQAFPGIITGCHPRPPARSGGDSPDSVHRRRFLSPAAPRSPMDQTMALPYHLYVISTQVPGMPLSVQYGTALVLLALVLSLNIARIPPSSTISGESANGRAEQQSHARGERGKRRAFRPTRVLLGG